MIRRITVVSLSMIFCVLAVTGQTADITDGVEGNGVGSLSDDLILEQDVKHHKGVDAIYRGFSLAYRTYDANRVANLYTRDAAYLTPNPKSGVRVGRKAILDGFTGSFKRNQERGVKMEIAFTILQRRVHKKMGYDVGIFDLKYTKDGKVVSMSKGKFVVVVLKGKDKKWRFQVDSYNDFKPQDN